MEVGHLDSIVIDDRDAPHAGAHQILQHRTAETARTDDEHRSDGEFRLTGRSDLAQDRLARVAARSRRHDFLVAAIQAFACPIGSA